MSIDATLEVRLGERPYDILIGQGVLESAGEAIRDRLRRAAAPR